MTSAPPPAACRQCGREPADGRTDAAGWCDACRAGVVRRATPLALAAAAAFSVAYLAVLGWTGALHSTNFVVFWLALGALLAFGTYKVARRVAFDVLRARAARATG